MRNLIVIVLALVVLVGVLIFTPWVHDFVAVGSTRYAPDVSGVGIRIS